jgi:hypothetical protein
VLARHGAHDASEAAAHGSAGDASGLSDSLSSGRVKAAAANSGPVNAQITSGLT